MKAHNFKKLLYLYILCFFIFTLFVAGFKSSKFYFYNKTTPKFPRKNTLFYYKTEPQVILKKIQELKTTKVPLTHYDEPIGDQYSCTAISQWVISCVSAQELPEVREHIRECLDFLMDISQTTPEGNIIYPFNFDWIECNETKPWYSSMTQGTCASAFIWGYLILEEPKYLIAAKSSIKALAENNYQNSFVKQVREGIWLKEYPHFSFCVLDGSLTAIAGVYNCYKVLKNNDPDKAHIKKLLDDSLKGFKSNAHIFQSTLCGHFFSDQHQFPSHGYHNSNLRLLEYLSEYDPDLIDIANNFSVKKHARIKSFLAVYYAAYRKILVGLNLKKPTVS